MNEVANKKHCKRSLGHPGLHLVKYYFLCGLLKSVYKMLNYVNCWLFQLLSLYILTHLKKLENIWENMIRVDSSWFAEQKTTQNVATLDGRCNCIVTTGDGQMSANFLTEVDD